MLAAVSCEYINNDTQSKKPHMINLYVLDLHSLRNKYIILKKKSYINSTHTVITKKKEKTWFKKILTKISDTYAHANILFALFYMPLISSTLTCSWIFCLCAFLGLSLFLLALRWIWFRDIHCPFEDRQPYFAQIRIIEFKRIS